MTDQLTILGASVRAAAHSALRAGLAPYAIDLFADRDLAAVSPAIRISNHPSDFAAALAAAPASCWIYTGGLENHPRLVDRLAAMRPLLGNGGRTLRRIRDPAALLAAAQEAGCRFPAWTAQPTAAAGWLQKPRHSSGGKSICWATPTSIPTRAARAYWQMHIAGQSASAVYVAAAGRAVLLGATRQLVGSDFELSRPFLYAGSIGPLLLSPPELERLVTLGNVLATRFELQGLFNIDFIRNEAGIWVLEVNPRYSASVEVLERISNVPFLRLHVTACQEQLLPVAASSRFANFAGKAVVYAKQDCGAGPRFENLLSQWNVAGEALGIADLPNQGQRFAAGDPVATVLVSGDSDTEVEAELRSRVTRVQETMSTE